MDEFKYKDILNMQYPNTETENDFPDKILREAQFAPFAALSGYDDVVKETARQTETKIELDEYEIEHICNQLRRIIDPKCTQPIFVTYFVRDKKKPGGAYVSKSGTVAKIKEYERVIVMDDKTEIPIDDIYSIDENISDKTS